jgi:hypothetical protein
MRIKERSRVLFPYSVQLVHLSSKQYPTRASHHILLLTT